MAGCLVAKENRIDVSGITTCEGPQSQVQLYRSPVVSVSFFACSLCILFFVGNFVLLAAILDRGHIYLGFLCHVYHSTGKMTLSVIGVKKENEMS